MEPDKAVEKIASLIDSNFDEIIVTQAYKNGLPVEQLESFFNNTPSPGHITVARTIHEAYEAATCRAKETGKAVIVIGGLFLAIEYWAIQKGMNPQDLAFF